MSNVLCWASYKSTAEVNGIRGEYALEALRRVTGPARHTARVDATVAAAIYAATFGRTAVVAEATDHEQQDARLLIVLDLHGSHPRKPEQDEESMPRTTARMPWAAKLGKGRWQATDGGAYYSAAEAARDTLPHVTCTPATLVKLTERHIAARGAARAYAETKLRALADQWVRQNECNPAYSQADVIQALAEWDACVAGMEAAWARTEDFLDNLLGLACVAMGAGAEDGSGWTVLSTERSALQLRRRPECAPQLVALLRRWAGSMIAYGTATEEELESALLWLDPKFREADADGGAHVDKAWQRAPLSWLNLAVMWGAPSMLWTEYETPVGAADIARVAAEAKGLGGVDLQKAHEEEASSLSLHYQVALYLLKCRQAEKEGSNV